jgi:hypothetical protein
LQPKSLPRTDLFFNTQAARQIIPNTPPIKTVQAPAWQLSNACSTNRMQQQPPQGLQPHFGHETPNYQQRPLSPHQPLQHCPSLLHTAPLPPQQAPTEHDEYPYDPLRLPLLQVRVCDVQELPHGTDDAA